MTIEEIQQKVIKFRDDRNWKQFHNPKDLALSLTLEAAEVMEKFQWKNSQEMGEYIQNNRSNIAEEIADVFKYLLIICHDLNINLEQATLKKMKKDNQHYPVKKTKGKHTKYTEL